MLQRTNKAHILMQLVKYYISSRSEVGKYCLFLRILSSRGRKKILPPFYTLFTFFLDIGFQFNGDALSTKACRFSHVAKYCRFSKQDVKQYHNSDQHATLTNFSFFHFFFKLGHPFTYNL